MSHGYDILSLTFPLEALDLESVNHSNPAIYVTKNSTCVKLKRPKDVPKTSLFSEKLAGQLQELSPLSCCTSQIPCCPFLGTTMLYYASQLSQSTCSHLTTLFHLTHSVFATTFTKYFFLPLRTLWCSPHKQKHPEFCHTPRPLVKSNNWALKENQ